MAARLRELPFPGKDNSGEVKSRQLHPDLAIPRRDSSMHHGDVTGVALLCKRISGSNTIQTVYSKVNGLLYAWHPMVKSARVGNRGTPGTHSLNSFCSDLRLIVALGRIQRVDLTIAIAETKNIRIKKTQASYSDTRQLFCYKSAQSAASGKNHVALQKHLLLFSTYGVNIAGERFCDNGHGFTKKIRVRGVLLPGPTGLECFSCIHQLQKKRFYYYMGKQSTVVSGKLWLFLRKMKVLRGFMVDGQGEG